METPQDRNTDPILDSTGDRHLNRDRNPIPFSNSRMWPTIDGPLGLSEEDSVSYARRFYKFGFAMLPLLWAVNCFYFWPVLRHSKSFPRIRPYVVGSAVGCIVFTAILSSWALTFAVGGEDLFGPVWDKLVMYNLADRMGLTGVQDAEILNTLREPTMSSRLAPIGIGLDFHPSTGSSEQE